MNGSGLAIIVGERHKKSVKRALRARKHLEIQTFFTRLVRHCVCFPRAIGAKAKNEACNAFRSRPGAGARAVGTEGGPLSASLVVLVNAEIGEPLREPRRDVVDAGSQDRIVRRPEIRLERYRCAVSSKAIRNGHRTLRADHYIGDTV